jgi:kynurenine formamidase
MRTVAAGVAGMVGSQMADVRGAGATTAETPGRARPGALEAGGDWADGSTWAGMLSHIRLVNLSHVNDPGRTPIFPGDPAFVLSTMTTVADDGFYMQHVCEGEHTGTHWGAPAHFQEGGRFADELELRDLFLPAVKIDVRRCAADDDDYGVTVDDVRRWERRHGRIPRGAAIVLWTGWSSRWGTDDYANLDKEGKIHQPGFLPETVQWLIDHGRLAERGAIGTDTFGADRGIDETYEATTLLFDRRRISLENLTNLRSLPTRGAHILVGGPINKNGSGSTATIMALVPPGVH